MRPPEFTGGNDAGEAEFRRSVTLVASMRPPEFTGGNRDGLVVRHRRGCRFNEAAGIHRRKHRDRQDTFPAKCWSFNEAAGIHRRKRGDKRRACAPPQPDGRFNEAAGIHRRKTSYDRASMRPPELRQPNLCQNLRFNEAAGIHRRKPGDGADGGVHGHRCFNEAAGIHRRKRTAANSWRLTELLAWPREVACRADGTGSIGAI